MQHANDILFSIHSPCTWYILISFTYCRFGGGIFFDILNVMYQLIYLVSMDYLFLKQWLSLDPFSILCVNLKVERKRGIDNQALQRTQYKMLNKANRRYEKAKRAPLHRNTVQMILSNSLKANFLPCPTTYNKRPRYASTISPLSLLLNHEKNKELLPVCLSCSTMHGRIFTSVSPFTDFRFALQSLQSAD